MLRKVSLLILFILPCFVYASSWIQRADFGGKGRHRGTAIHIGNKGYMGLGHYNGAGPNIVLKDWWEYDPASNSWTQRADYIGNASGAYAVLSFGMDQYGYVGGGQTATNTNFYRFDPSTNTWSQVSNSPTIPQNNEGFVIGNKGYYMSGSQLYEYDATLNSWTTKNLAPFTIGVWNSAFTINEKGYIKNGASLWEYKPSTDQWISRASFPGLASGGSTGFSHRGKGYIVGGYSGWLSNVNSEVWEYSPESNTWLQLEDFLGTSRRFGSGFSIGNRSFVGIGTNGTNFKDFWEFDKLAGMEGNASEGIHIFPNPASEQVTIQSGLPGNYELLVYNSFGQLVHQETRQTKQSTLRPEELGGYGMYHVHIIVNQELYSKGTILFIRSL